MKIHMRLLSAILLLLVSRLACAVEPQLLMAVYEYDAWLRVKPTMMLYDDGTLLYEPLPSASNWMRRTIADPSRWMSERLSTSLSEEKHHYNVSSSLHAVTTVVWTLQAKLSIRGDWRREAETVEQGSIRPEIVEQGSVRREIAGLAPVRLPKPVGQMLEELEHERSQPGESWTWRQIELQLLPMDDANGDFPSWPSDWPDSLAMATRRCGVDELYALRMPASLTAPLHELLAAPHQRNIVLIDGRKMQVAAHAVLPEESQWLPACPFELLPL